MKVSVLIPCFNRHKLVERSLFTLSRQTYPVDVFLVDDGSRPGLEKIAKDAGVIYERIRDPLPPNSSALRGPATCWNHIYQKTDHDFVIVTHPEILVPFDAVERMIDQHESPRRSTPLLYMLDRKITKSIEEYPWREDVHCFQEISHFRSIYNRWGLYNYDMHTWKHHICFSGQTREDWEICGFIPVLDIADKGNWDDAWLWAREQEFTERTGINYYVNQIDLTVYHQFHGETICSSPANDIWYMQNYNYPAPHGGVVAYSPRISRIRSAAGIGEDE